MAQLPDGAVYCVGRKCAAQGKEGGRGLLHALFIHPTRHAHSPCSYVEHIKELPGLLDIPDELPTVPMIFLKTPAAIQRGSDPISLPSWSKNVQHEVELAVQLGPDLQPCVAAISLDLTARDVQVQERNGLHLAPRAACPSAAGHWRTDTWLV